MFMFPKWTWKGLKGAAVISILALAGCTAVPTVQYVKVEKETQLNGKEIDAYYLPGSVITALPRKVEVDGKLVEEVIIQSKPAEYKKFKLALRKADSIGVKTTVNISKIENTDLVSEIGTEVSDQRLEYIEKIGGAIVSIASKAFSLTGGFPEVRLEEHRQMISDQPGDEGEIIVDENDATGLTIKIGKKPVDAIRIKDIPFPIESNSFFYSACREALVTYEPKKGEKITRLVKIADPRFVQRVAFPIKGKIKTHSECGVSVQTEKDTGVVSNAALIQGIVNQGLALKAVIDKKNSDDN